MTELDALGDNLKNAIMAARDRTGDASITARIGSSPDPELNPMPGLVSIERDGADTVYGLAYDDAIATLDAMA